MQPRRAYGEIIEHIFHRYYTEGDERICFERKDIAAAAQEVGVEVPSNVGDVVYSFRYRALLPESVREKAPSGKHWIIRSVGTSRYCFVLASLPSIMPNPALAEAKLPDATPGIIAMHALTDEQALLAKLRYNRLIDIFTGITTYSLQSHLRTQVAGAGQVETDELYVGVDRRGAQYVLPVQAKGGRDVLSVVQIERDIALCAAKFPQLICRPIAAQFMGDLIALFEFTLQDDEVRIAAEKHYRLVPPDSIGDAELREYQARQD